MSTAPHAPARPLLPRPPRLRLTHASAVPKLGEAVDDEDPTSIDATPPPPPAPRRETKSDVRALVLGKGAPARRLVPPRPVARAKPKAPPPIPGTRPITEAPPAPASVREAAPAPAPAPALAPPPCEVSSSLLLDDTEVEVVPPSLAPTLPAPEELVRPAPSGVSDLEIEEALGLSTQRRALVVAKAVAFFIGYVAVAAFAYARAAAPGLAERVAARLGVEWTRAEQRARAPFR